MTACASLVDAFLGVDPERAPVAEPAALPAIVPLFFPSTSPSEISFSTALLPSCPTPPPADCPAVGGSPGGGVEDAGTPVSPAASSFESEVIVIARSWKLEIVLSCVLVKYERGQIVVLGVQVGRILVYGEGRRENQK